jgi:hypothetical protein
LIAIFRGEDGRKGETISTGAIADSSVSSRTFSIEDFDGSREGGLTKVGWSAIAVEVNVCL